VTLLRDVIDIPERVTATDFVVGLAEGVEHKQQTLATYVVTPQVAQCFDQALGLVASAITGQRSQAAFLHGSFGSGKSHFMAVLYQLLRQDPDARAVPELGEVVAKHDGVLQGKRILPLTYHLIGATSLEQAVLGGYVRHVRALHPDSQLPAVHRSDALLDNADQRRVQDGDARFFELLNERPAAAGFGGLGAKAGAPSIWDERTYDEARRQPEGDPRRSALVSDLVRTMFSAFATTESYVDLDTGLGVVSRHAADLGYDAVVLFLDELILWLATHLQNREFITNEGAKLAKLVEAQDAHRAVPLVSLISRQRDITEFLGEHVPGAERSAFADVFGWSRGRFDDIRLEDRNLPVIAEKRLLKPKDAAGRQAIDAAFAQIDRRPDVWDVLLSGSQVEGGGTGSDQEAFRRTYPFSPALVATLVALSQALQRERTALKVMLQLLVDGRDELEVNDLVPVGDLFDVLVDSDSQAVTPELAKQFDKARRIYHSRLRRALLDVHQLTEAQAQHLDRRHAFRTDDRLVKTLILSALAPDVPALTGLTASRLAALNHGTIQAWLPGEEVSLVLHKMKQIASQVSEVHVGEGDDPVISLELTDVDPEGVIELARAVDNEGNRRRALRELVWQSLGVRESETLDGVQSQTLVWRGRRVSVDLVFGNVRDASDLPDSALMASDDRWKVVVDYPFDAEGQNPMSDLSRVESLQQRGVTSNTLLWVPGFFTAHRLEDLGTFVVLEHVLGGDRFHQYSSHLNPADREQARIMLRQRRDVLRERLLDCLKQAYDVARRADADIDTANALETAFLTLADGFTPQKPVGATLGDAFQHVVSQALSWTWPAHPRFEPGDQEVRPADVRRVLELCEEAVDEPGGRVQVEPAHRAVVRRVCNTLEVGRMHENHLVLDQSTFPWSRRLQQAAARDGLTGRFPVRDLLGYLDEPDPRGLDRAVSGLVIRVFALMEDLAWYRDDVAVAAPAPEQVTAAYELRQPQLPEQDAWERAVRTGRDALGVRVTDLRNAANLVRLATGAREVAQSRAGEARELERLLAQHKADLGVADDSPERWATAAAVRTLLDALQAEGDDLKLVESLAAVTWPTSAAAARRSLDSAQQVGRRLRDSQWDVFRALGRVVGERADAARSLLERLADTASRDELAASLASDLPEVQREAIRVLTAEPNGGHEPKVEPGGGTGSTETLTVRSDDIETALARIRAAAAGHDGSITVTWRLDP
jgi:hypothetical protein